MVAKFENLVGGRWVTATGGAWFHDHNPADARMSVGAFPSMVAADATAALDVAAAGFRAWADATPVARGSTLRTAAEMLRAQADDIARDVTREMGKTLGEAAGEVQTAANFFEYYGSFGRHPFGSILPDARPHVRTTSHREPVGVVVAITPWNDPVLTPARKLAPALIAGNSVVIKPSPLTPLSAWHLCRVLHEAGIPEGVVNMVTGSADELSGPLLQHRAVRAVTFTGSTRVGYLLARALHDRNVRLQTEMGGKNAAVVLEDADIDMAIDAIVAGAFGQAGQRCTATSRVIAHVSIAADLQRSVAERADALKLGDGLDPETQMGPVVSEPQLENVLGFVARARASGISVACGGSRSSGTAHEHGYFVRPTVMTDVKQESPVWQEEIFGPVVGVRQFETLDEAIDLVNDTRYGLSASIHTQNLGAAHEFTRRVEAGNVTVNLPTVGWDVHVPFGGFKDSGSSFKEHGHEGLQFYTRVKSVAMRAHA